MLKTIYGIEQLETGSSSAIINKDSWFIDCVSIDSDMTRNPHMKNYARRLIILTI